MVVSFNGYINTLRTDLMSQEATIAYLEPTVIDLTEDGDGIILDANTLQMIFGQS